MNIKALKSSLTKAGFIPLKKRGKGSHTILRHPINHVLVVVSGKDSKEAKYYQVKALNIALAQASMNA